MKRCKKNKTLIIITLALASLFLGVDLSKYHYGNSFFNYGLLPFDLIPKQEEWGFYINDSTDFPIIGEGFRYVRYPELKTKRILSYGYKTDLIVVKVLCDDNNIYYFSFDKHQTPTILHPTKDIESLSKQFVINTM